jgi:hypothetical protein
MITTTRVCPLTWRRVQLQEVYEYVCISTELVDTKLHACIEPGDSVKQSEGDPTAEPNEGDCSKDEAEPAQRYLMRFSGAFNWRQTRERMFANRGNNRTDATVPNERLMVCRRGYIEGWEPTWQRHGALLRKSP